MDGMKKKLAFLLSTSPYLDVVDGRSYEKAAEDLMANGVTFATDTNDGGKWMPVTERLPEETRVPKDVLVYHKLGNCGIYVDRAWYDSDKNKWRSALSMNMNVTHWMPLPEPPAATLNQGQEL